jgi:hypothetical protein
VNGCRLLDYCQILCVEGELLRMVAGREIESIFRYRLKKIRTKIFRILFEYQNLFQTKK